MKAIILRFVPLTMLDMVKRYCEFSSGESFPKDMRCKGVYYDFDTDSIQLRVTSQTFADIQRGKTVPHAELRLK